MLARNKELEFLCEQLHEHPVEWEALLDDALQIVRTKKALSNLGHWKGTISELHLAKSIKTIAAQYPALRVEPLLFPPATQSYEWQEHEPGVIIIRRGTTEAVTDYDYFATVNGLPVVFESKARRLSNVADVFNPNHPRLRPAIELTGQQPGYVICVSKSAYKPESVLQYSFQDAGGIIVSLPYKDKEYIRELKAHVQPFIGEKLT